MDDSEAKEQATAGGRSTSGLLRYPLRSAKKEKQSVEDYSNPSSVSASKRGKSALSSVSKSVSVLHVSGESKEKSAKPPRRLSVPSNSNDSPASASIITPISEAKSKRSNNPLSDVTTKSSARRKFSALTSASYWLSQIKLSESAAKHNVSLGFFKLAYDAGCEPLQMMVEELRSYVQRHDLSELEDLVKDLLDCYKNSGNEQSQVSSPCSEVPNERDHPSEKNVHRSLSTTMDADESASETHQGKTRNDEPAQADESEKKIRRSSSRKNASSSKSGSDLKDRSIPMQSGNLKKQESAQNRGKTKKIEKISAHGEGTLNTPPEEALQEDKENTASAEMKGIVLALEI